MEPSFCLRRPAPLGIVAALFGISLFAIAGCGEGSKDSGESAQRPFAGAKVRIAVPPGSKFAERWQSLLIEWGARTGAEPEVVELALDSIDTAKLIEADLLVFPLAILPDLTAGERLAPIPNALQGDEGLRWSDVPRGLSSNVLSIDRKPVAVPFACPVLTLYYRKDLLSKAGLTAPQTWDEYQKLLDTLDRWAPELTAAEPWGESFRGTMFLARGAAAARHPENFSFLFDIETGAPLLDSPAWEQTLEASKAALARMSADVLSYGPEDCRRALLEGKAALAIAWETPGSLDEGRGGDAKPGVSRAEGIALGITRLPGARSVYNRSTKQWETQRGGVNRVETAGFAGLAAGVSAKSEPVVAQAAWNLIVTLSEPSTLLTAFPGTARSACRISQVDEGRVWYGPELTAAEGGGFLHATLEALRDSHLTAEMPVAHGSQFRAALAEGITPALRGETSPAVALAGVQKKWQGLVDARGADSIRKNCRRQLGL